MNRNTDFASAILLGILIGVTGHAMFGTASMPWGDVLVATVTVFVGWSLQRALKRGEDLDHVPLDALARCCQRLESGALICSAFQAGTLGTDPEALKAIRALSLELDWLLEVTTITGLPDAEWEQLFEALINVDEALTGHSVIQIGAAGVAARAFRTQIMRFQWRFSRHLLENPPALD